jgi:cellulose synthase (UDP-forming)
MDATTFCIVIAIVLVVLIVVPTRQRKQETDVPPAQQTQATSLAAQSTQEKKSAKRHLVQRMMNDITLTQLMLGITLVISILFLRGEVQLSIGAFHVGKYWFATQACVLVSIVVFQIYGYFTYHLTRIGYFKRFTSHKLASHKELEEFFYKQQVAPPLAVLVPSYKEDVHVIKQTLLSAALQEYPHLRVILLIDDPPAASSQEDSMKLNAARHAAQEIHLLLSQQAKRFQRARQSFATRLSQGPLDSSSEMAHLAALYEEAAQWFKEQAETYIIGTHTDEFFVQHILLLPR